MAFFNILITSLPPIAIATFERDIPEKAIENVRHHLGECTVPFTDQFAAS